ncbi:MAG: amylo-alpha-1,6-glucosidase [bacterium]|nr:amylo-alpha-1,6-glucosidase [bacterium]
MNPIQTPGIDESKLQNVLWDLGLTTLHELETDDGILASGRQEAYGCLFGRDSLITALKLLKVYDATGNEYFANLTRKILLNLAAHQGTAFNIESGEEPGKCIHEFRPSGHEHLTRRAINPWYVYTDNSMRNYDSVDATPLFLIAIARYHQRMQDAPFMDRMLPHGVAALKWLMELGDSNGDGFIDYRIHPERKSGGLTTQSWMDSAESVFHEDGTPVTYPIAPVEVQAYSWLALRLWSDFLKATDPERARNLRVRADELSANFAERFFEEEEGTNGLMVASAIDGSGRPLRSVRSSMGHCLWASLTPALDATLECIVPAPHIPAVAARLLAEDLFEPDGGIRTLSARSTRYDPESYHNGSIWPHDNGLIIEGLDAHGYKDHASRIRRAILGAYAHFETPLELFTHRNGALTLWKSASGQEACKKQAWSAAALLQQVAALRLQAS